MVAALILIPIALSGIGCCFWSDDVSINSYNLALPEEIAVHYVVSSLYVRTLAITSDFSAWDFNM